MLPDDLPALRGVERLERRWRLAPRPIAMRGVTLLTLAAMTAGCPTDPSTDSSAASERLGAPEPATHAPSEREATPERSADASSSTSEAPDEHPASATTPSSPGRWSEPWLLAQAERYLHDRAFRRAQLEASLVNPDNTYSATRLGSYARPQGGWDALPEWVPVARPVTTTVVDELRDGRWPTLRGATPLWDGEQPEDLAAWVELGRRVFFEYPLRPEVFAEHALAHPEIADRVGLRPAPDGTWPGVVVFADLDRRIRVGITCALCHVAVEDEQLLVGRAHRDLDYGQMRLAYHRDTGAPLPERLADRMATWGRGRADITQDDDEDPVAIPDLWAIQQQAHLTQAGTLRHAHPAALAIRQETQILHANRERTRPPRALAWALAMYVYSLRPPPPSVPEPTPRKAQAIARGHALFERHCQTCHRDDSGSGPLVPAERAGTDPTLAFGRARGTGQYRPSPLVRIADAAPYLHHGAVPSLDDLLDPARLRPDYTRGTRGAGAVPGHAFGTTLPLDQRAALIAYLRTR